MEKILKNIFFENDNMENNLKFYTLVGPFLLIVALSFTTLDFTILSLLSLFFCYRVGYRGLFLSLISLFTYSIFIQVNLNDKHLWNLGLESSIALSLIISTLGFDEIRFILSKNDKTTDIEDISKKDNTYQNFSSLQNNFLENINILKAQIENKDNLINAKNEEIEKLKFSIVQPKQNDNFLIELNEKNKEIESLKNTQDELYEKIAFLKDEEFLQEKNKSLLSEIEILDKTLKLKEEELNKISNDVTQKK